MGFIDIHRDKTTHIIEYSNITDLVDKLKTGDIIDLSHNKGMIYSIFTEIGNRREKGDAIDLTLGNTGNVLIANRSSFNFGLKVF